MGSFVIAGIIRYLLIVSKYSTLIQNRVEVSTPLNSWKRGKYHKIKNPQYIFNLLIVLKTVKEGAFLYNAGINPYSGDMYHENPLILVASNWLLTHCSQLIPLLFISIDLLVAMLLFFMAKRFIKEMVRFSFFNPKIAYFSFTFIHSIKRNKMTLERSYTSREQKSFNCPRKIP